MLLLGRIYIALAPWLFGDFRSIFLPNIGEDQKNPYNFSSGPLTGTQARSQKFAMGGGGPPVAGGQWKFGGEAPSVRKFLIFCKNS